MKSLYKITALLLTMIIAMSLWPAVALQIKKNKLAALLTLPEQRLKSLPKSTKLSICFPLAAS